MDVMLFSERPLAGMGAPPLPNPQPEARHFPQWSRTAILTLATLSEDDVVGEVGRNVKDCNDRKHSNTY